MVSSGDVQKRRAWEARLARYRSSGLSVMRFCAQEQVSTHTFYYWVKRLRTEGTRASSRADQPPLSPACPSAAATLDNTTPGAVVRFRWKTGGEVLVPADRIDVIRCLAECFTAAGGQHAFQEVVVKA